MVTSLVQLLVKSQGAEKGNEWEQKLACRAACDVTGGSGAVQVRMDTGLLQLLVMPRGSEQVIGHEQNLACRASCDVTGSS